MAVALATLPLNRVLAGAGDTFLTIAAGAGLAAVLTGWTAGLAGATAFLAAGLTGGFATGFLAALPLGLMFLAAALLTATFLATTFFGAGFFAATFLTATFFTGAFFAIGFFTTDFFTAAFFATGFFAGAAFFAGDLATVLPATGFLATTFFVTLPADFAALRLAFAEALLAPTARPLAAAFAVPALASRTLVEALPLCALAAVELRVVFAISLHRFWPWRPGVIAHVSYTSKLASGILVPLPAASRSGTVNALTRLILWMLRLYKRWLSPLLGSRCRFHPSCSDYARIAVARFGPWHGGLLAGWRLLRCQPLCDGGEDQVPDHFHFSRCRRQGDSTDIG